MKTAIYSLYQKKELGRASFFVRRCLPSLGESRQLLILVNDEGMDGFADFCRGLSPYIHVLGGERNLGVAGGRNELIRYGLQAGFEFFISCDNDILFDEGYFARIEQGYERIRKSDARVGLVQPVLLDGRRLKPALGLADVANWQEFGDGARLDKSLLQRPWSWFASELGPEKAGEAIYHAGISNPWIAHFSGTTPDDASDLPWGADHEALYGTVRPTLRLAPDWLAGALSAGTAVRVFTVAGGITAFHKDVIRANGDYNEKFNPFGYEDSEFGFRATQKGLNNYLLCDVLAIHDPFMGASNRELPSHATIARLRAIEIADLPVNDPRRAYALGQALFFCWSGHNNQVRAAITHGEIAKADAVRSAAGFFASYVLNFLYGLFGTTNCAGNASKGHLFDRLLPTGFSGHESRDVALELGRGTRFRASDLKVNTVEGGGQRRVLSLCAMNCRLEEGDAEKPSAISRYFDAYLILEEKADHEFELRVNLQANAETFAAKVAVDVTGPMSSEFRTPPKVKLLSSARNTYDLGSFSTEDIYPAPSFGKSQKWLPELVRETGGIRATGGAFSWLVDPLLSYLSIDGSQPQAAAAKAASAAAVQPVAEKPAADVATAATMAAIAPSAANKPVPAPVAPSPSQDIGEPTVPTTPKTKRVLVFTDSRGQHKPAGQEHQIFGERIKDDPRLEVDLFLCPMKWTTTLDFLEMFDAKKLATYDAVVLWTGIVDWSPRPVSSAINDLYDNTGASNLENAWLNTRDYSKKVVNNKKAIFDEVFGADRMRAYFATPFETVYANEKTSNMYGLEMAKQHLVPRLAAIKNLIFINANRFVPGWEGDFKKGRPANIDVTHGYSDLFSDGLAATARIVDLRKWSHDQVKYYTCDNIHVTKAGSDYIYDEVMKAIGLPGLAARRGEPAATVAAKPPGATTAPAVAAKHEPKQIGQLISKGMVSSFTGISRPERFLGKKQAKVLEAAGAGKYLATLIIGVRLKPGDVPRMRNFEFLLKWLEHHYSGLFDLLIVEQDSQKRLDFQSLGLGPHARYEFIYNPGEYNRGWGYNVAVKHFCADSKVVVLMDTDVLTGSNFVREVMDCHSKYDAISPYQNIYYSNEEEVESVYAEMRIDHLANARRIKNPVTVAGGLLIIRRDTYLNLKGFEQYVGYGCEDRAFDVTLFNHVPEARLRIAPVSYVHLFHPRDLDGRGRFDEIYEHLVSNYGCKYEKALGPFDFIHKHCEHASPLETLALMRARAESFGDPDLYASGGPETVNGTRPRRADAAPNPSLILPPDFTSVFEYKQKEIYASAPPPDSEELATFYNAYKGKRCFIIGNGPSLNKHDLSLLKDEYTFGVNSFYYKTRETGFTPYFYVVEDSSVMKENIEEIRKYDAPFKFFPTNYKALHPKQPNTFFFRMNRGFYEKSSPNYVVPRFSTDASDVLYCGQSVTYINLQLAYFMGFEEVYLIGMDFSYVIPSSHSRKGDVLISDTDDPNHFHKDYFGKGKSWKDPKLDRVALNYRMARLVYESTGRRVFNATVGGNLDVFERVDYERLLKPAAAGSRIAQASASLREANNLYRAKDYSGALSAFVQLARADEGFALYRRSALDAFLQAREAGQVCGPADVSFVRSQIGL